MDFVFLFFGMGIAVFYNNTIKLKSRGEDLLIV